MRFPALIASLLLGAVAAAGCGYKGALRPPPAAPAQAAQSAQAEAVQAGHSAHP